jgi:type I restriction enzyme S subunit
MIGTVLGTIDEMVLHDRRRAEVLEEMVREVYREWFVRFRFPGHDACPLVDSPLGPIPQDWRVDTVGELSAAVTRGITPKYAEDGEWVVLNQKCVRDERVSFVAARRQNRKVPDVKSLRFGDVLVNSTGVGTLGRVAMYRGHNDHVTVDSHVTIARPADERLNPWWGLVLATKTDELVGLSTGSTGQTELSRGAVCDVRLVAPPWDILGLFSGTAWPILNLVDSLLDEAAVLAKLRDLLLPGLVTGRIDVSKLNLDDLIDEVS